MSSFGFITTDSSSSQLQVSAYSTSDRTPVVGRSVYVDIELEDGHYRALGTVTDITTQNSQLKDPRFNAAASKEMSGNMRGTDTRTLGLKIQSTYYRTTPEQGWQKASSALPTSPATGTPVRLLGLDEIEELVHDDVDNLIHLGTMRGLPGVHAPLVLPDFASQTGARHSGVLGRSGAGKALSLDTRIPTPTGWTTMRDIQDGDVIFDEKGNKTTVLKAHDVQYDRDVYEVFFSDGSSIKADADHLWYTEDKRSRKSFNTNRFKEESRQRKPRLSDLQRNALRWEALNSSEDEVITLTDARKIASITTSKVWAERVAAGVGIEGYITTERVCTYTKGHYSSRKVLSYDAESLLSHFISTEDKWFTPERKQSMKAELSSLEINQRFTLREFASIVNSSPRNGNLVRKIQKSGIDSTKEHSLVESRRDEPLEIVKHFGKVPTYNKKRLLLKLASSGEVILKDQRHRHIQGSVKTTEQIMETIEDRHSIPVAKPIDTPNARLRIDPYVLGAWLGDGSSTQPIMHGVDSEIKDAFVAAGYPISSEYQDKRSKNEGYREWYFSGLLSDLRELGLLSNKHIPDRYLRSSIEQRRALLAGLMDTDGNACRGDSTVEFTNTNKQIAYGVHELAVSLGYRPTITEGLATLYGRVISPKWTVRWSTNDAVFRLTRKRTLHAEWSKKYNSMKNSQRYIINIRKVESEPVRCITVDSASSLFLAGESMIPTHNTAFATFTLSSQMSHESHGLIVIDPQGQWASENGFLFSVQKFAKAIGREVSVLRVSEDIKLPMDLDLLSALFSEVDLWGRGFQRMGQENKEAFSEAVSERLIAKYWDKNTDFDNINPQELLAEAFLAIARSTGSLRRIYASVDRMESFAFSLRVMGGAVFADARAELEAEQEEAGQPISPEEWADAEHTWNHRLLPRFTPLINLFTNKNLHGAKRTSLGGQSGFLTDVMQVRSADPAVPAPYVILDMSSDVSVHEKSAYAAGAGEIDTGEQMRAMLDNADIKALIVSTVLDEIKKSSETAFAEGGGNLNTQIVFDEAWRYAPNVPSSEADTPIGKLSSKLEGFALDTRKYGIGWTYILQSPSDLNKGIWKQLTFVYTGFGIIGADKGMLGSLMDEKEKDGQMGLYDQFAPPTSTGKYPFMITGPISPLIFTNTPVFVDAYNTVEAFIDANSHWIERIIQRRNLPPLNPSALGVGRKPRKKTTSKKSDSSTGFVVGGSTKSTASKPQFTPKQKEPKKKETPAVDSGFDIGEPPF